MNKLTSLMLLVVVGAVSIVNGAQSMGTYGATSDKMNNLQCRAQKNGNIKSKVLAQARLADEPKTDNNQSKIPKVNADAVVSKPPV